MTPARRFGYLAAGAALLCGGCASATPAVRSSPAGSGYPASTYPASGYPGSALSLASSQATSRATWAVLPMGGGGANQFWQLFRLPASGGPWKLQTPPDIATNGALALAGVSGTSLVAGIRPALHLTFSPVSQTRDGGQHWTVGPPAAGLAGVPDALAATPDGRQLLSLSQSGQVSTADTAGGRWAGLVTQQALAATPDGRRCGLGRLTAVGYTPGGARLVAGTCARPGAAGIFTLAGTSWRAAGPALPAALSGDQIQVLRLVAVADRTVAVLRAGSGPRAELAAAWLNREGQWAVSPPLSLAGTAVRTTAFGLSGGVAVTLGVNRGAILPGPGGSWRPAPLMPPGRSVVLVLPSGGQVQALSATGNWLTSWQLSDDGKRWVMPQEIKVPIQYDSSS